MRPHSGPRQVVDNALYARLSDPRSARIPQICRFALHTHCRAPVPLLRSGAVNTEFLQLCRRGVDLVAEFQGCSEQELIEAGASQLLAAQLAHLQHTYFGRTSNSRKQRLACEAARSRGHDLAVLESIESFAQRVKDTNRSWDLRLELCRAEAHLIPAIAKKRLKQLNPAKRPSHGVRYTRRPDGPHTISITADPTDIADIKGVLASVDKENPLAAAKQVILEGNPGALPAVHTNVIITLDQLDRITASQSDDIMLQLSNGARMSGAQLVARTLAQRGYVSLVHPEHGAVNLYRTERMASWKQRMLARAEHPICAWPGCSTPADDAQVHHLTAWAAGGPTNQENLVTLCAHHNAVNQDDDSRPTARGRMVRIEGRIAWIPPWSGNPRFIPSPAYSPRPTRSSA